MTETNTMTALTTVDSTNITDISKDDFQLLLDNASKGSTQKPMFKFSGKDGSFIIKNGETETQLTVNTNPKKASLVAVNLYTWARGYQCFLPEAYVEEGVAPVLTAPLAERPSDKRLRIGESPDAPLYTDARGNDLYWKTFARAEVYGDQTQKIAGIMSFSGTAYSKSSVLLNQIVAYLKTVKDFGTLLKTRIPVFYIPSYEKKPTPDNSGHYFVPVFELYGFALLDENNLPNFNDITEV